MVTKKRHVEKRNVTKHAVKPVQQKAAVTVNVGTENMLWQIVAFIFFVGICLLAGAVGSFFTMPSIPTWYEHLNKPFFTPPNWLFAPVWTLLYILMGASAFLVWKEGWERHEVKSALAWFIVQLSLNMMWSAAFFGMRSPIAGFAFIALLWPSIAMQITKSYRVSKLAGWLLVPYILWVSYALLLNFAVMLLNPL